MMYKMEVYKTMCPSIIYLLYGFLLASVLFCFVIFYSVYSGIYSGNLAYWGTLFAIVFFCDFTIVELISIEIMAFFDKEDLEKK